MSVVRAISIGALGALGCGTSYAPGVEVRVVSAPCSLEPEEELDSVPAQRVRVFELYWTSSEFELLPCASARNRSLPSASSLASRAWSALVPDAKAHGLSTPEQLAVPTVERATHASPVELGVLHPAATRYCSARYRIGAADADALGIEQAPAMTGLSLGAHGEVESAPGASAPFSIESARSFEILRPVELDLSGPRRLTITIAHDKQRWFEGLAFDAADPEQREQTLVQNFQDSISIHVE